MPAVTPSFLMDFESNMRVISVNEYARMLQNLWVNRVAKTLQSSGRKEVIGWLLDTATIEDQGLGGNVAFEDMDMIEQEVVNLDSGKGLLIRKQQFEDLDGRGVQIGTKWAANIGAQMAYWPQKQISSLIKTGTAIGYDLKRMFVASTTIGTGATDAHPFNPNRPALGGFANDFTSAVSGSYPGAVPIDVTNAATVETALANLNRAISYVKSNIKMPNGVDPRFLKPTCLLHPPALTARAQQLTKAKFIAQSVNNTGGGGSGDVEAVIRNYGFGEPIEAPELSAANGGSDTTYYLICEEIAAADQLGATVYQVRENYSIVFHSAAEMSELARRQEHQWICHGRNAVAPGHPFMIFRCQAT